MSAEAFFLWAAALLLALGVAGGVFARERFAHSLVYGGALAMSAAMLVLALVELIRGEAGGALVLPLGIPWIGAHFRIDALSAVLSRHRQSRRRRGEPLRPWRRAVASLRRNACCHSFPPSSPE